MLAVVAWYRDAVSPALPPRCRFYPTCSAYAATALQRYGPARGSWLAVRRILRCGPWQPGGVDHVPALPATPDEAGSPAPSLDGEPPCAQRRVPSSYGNARASHHCSQRLGTLPKSFGPQRRSVSQETAVV
ncbi:MAG: membrane protein insertion efficiency factor YidD [Geodermatophilaceae bacterium]|nr:membrane protein insertion efficiency factor YidD [Geodermatophilaceae bacterium]